VKLTTNTNVSVVVWATRAFSLVTLARGVEVCQDRVPRKAFRHEEEQMIIISGKEYVAAEQRAAYLARWEDFIRRARTAPGCLDFFISADPIEENRVNMFELWASKEELDDYRSRAEPPTITTEVWGEDVKKYDISASGPPFP
jgi:quinol monooxygenase YgiN